MSRRDFAIVETKEGCLSIVITTPDLVIRAWLEGIDPELVGGHAVVLSTAGEDALRGHGEAGFSWRGTRAELIAMVRLGPLAIAADPRLEIDQDAAGRPRLSAQEGTTHTNAQELHMHRTDAADGAFTEAEAEAGRAHLAAIQAAFDTGDAELFSAAIDALERRLPHNEMIRERCRELRAEIQFVPRNEWSAEA